MAQTVILVMGANRGIGKGLISTYLARASTTVIATVRRTSLENTQELCSLQTGPSSQLILVSLSLDIPSDITDAIIQVQSEHHIEYIDLVIANAGICNHWGPVVDMDDSDPMAHFEVNTLGLLRLFRATAPLLLSRKQNKFVYISSELASIAGVAQSSSLTAAYGVSKAAGNYLVKKIDAEHADLVAFPIDPGFVQTDMGNHGAQCNGLERAPMTITESVQGIVKQIDGATKSTTSGQFIRYSGDRLPW
ncbi:hypothetical protein SI65_07450 [Aspergillus cristatus]|uniref:Uncharacterized protein n=1 Tax=Aspergillus cristatus TaxID=573508 RepID=A0A1E3B8C1_ASPCR|nr:hypothetical protein SI65_07450 [Aspergillus cristatus]